MKAVAFIELAIMVRVLIGAILLRNSLLSPLFYAHFLRQRWYQSAFTRLAVKYVGDRIERYTKAPGAPPVAVQGWDKFKFVLGKWAGSSTVGPQPAGARAQ